MVDNKPKFMSKQWLDDFFIPRNLVDVIFIVLCFVLAWYALKYDIPAAKTPIICANLWNEWAQERGLSYQGVNVTPANDMFNNCEDQFINITDLPKPNLSQSPK